MRSIVFNVTCLSVLLCNTLINACVEEPIVETKAGKIRGAKVIGTEGDVFCAFKGIPYAKAPLGELRFKDPEPVESWIDVKETTRNSPLCVQLDYILNNAHGSEDCLYMYVYTKNIDMSIRRPVMVWIHPGGFYWGNGDDSFYGPDYLMNKDIVLVSFNYRINVFGFLNLDNEVAPGNMGLKDQLLVLKWVRDNIAKFGGDPDNVTIFGNSAGGASVHYLTISPLTKGLYHKAIIQSGAAFNPWAFQLNPKERAIQLSNYLGHTNEDPQSIVEFLRTIDSQTIAKTLKEMFTKEEKIQMNWHFGPSIDSKSKEPFLPVHPDIAAANGVDVPLIIGHTNREGLLLYKHLQNAYGRFEKEFQQLLHPGVENLLKKYDMTFDNLRHIYFGNDPITNGNVDQVINMTGDLYFGEGIQKIVEIQIQINSSSTYFYQYTYDKEISILKAVLQTSMSGACHTDETFTLFRSHFMEGKMPFPKKGSEKYKIIEQMVDMWVNFATTGNPTPNPTELVPIQWKSIKNRSILEYLHICEDLRMDSIPSLKKKYATR